MNEISVLDTSPEAKIKIKKLIKEAMKKCLSPPPKLNLVEWADTFRYLPDNSAEAGRWKTDRVEAVREPMLSVSNPEIQEVTVMSCIQFMKHLSVETPMLTTKGWKTMGEMNVGDKVFGSNGHACNVIGTSEITDKEPCYEITFSDGEKIKCSESHNWNVDDSRNRTATVEYGVTKSTGEIFKTFKNDYGNRYSIPVCKPLNMRKKNLPINPYVLGCWLGDGHSYSARLSGHKDDKHIFAKIRSLGYGLMPKKRSEASGENAVEFLIQDFHSTLNNQKLIKGRNLNGFKHIPDIYFNSSKNQRLELLKGLMDTDGTISKKGVPSFSQSDPVLIQDFLRLCRGLGLKPTIKKLKTEYKDSYQIHIMSYSDFPVFSLPRKLNRMKNIKTPNLRISETRRRKIVNVEKIKNIPVKCIAVDSVDRLYLCGQGLIPTHNTELMLNTALFYMHQEPSPIMYVAPKKETAEAWSKERLVKSVNATPVVSDIFTNNRRGEGNTITQKQFKGGQISIVSARNPTDLAMRACRIMLFDECDKYPTNVGAGEQGSGGEGDPIQVAFGRATTYGKRAKKIVACSPTVQGKSRIEQEYNNSNMSVFYQPCKHCKHEKVLTWVDVLIPRNEDRTFKHQDAQISCSECGSLWNESDRMWSIRNGKWKATKPEVTWHHGYKVSSLASPFTPVTVLAKEFTDAQNNPEKLKAFYNTRMAEPWREIGEQPDWERLYERRENYDPKIIPDGALLTTCGIDVQKDHSYYEVMGWGRKKESWSLQIGIIEGNIEEAETKEKLSNFLDQLLVNSKGVNVPIMKTCIDSGYNTNEVYSFCRQHGSQSVVPVKGEDNLMTPIGTPTLVDVTVSGKRMSRGMQLWKVGSSVIKEQIYRWLNAKKPTDEDLAKGRTFPTGYCHYPQWDEEYFKQVTAEVYTKKTDNRGFFKYLWEKLRKDNHFLDCRVYNRAASAMLQIDRMAESDWVELEKTYSVSTDKTPNPVAERIPSKNRIKRRSNWIKR